MRIAYQQRDLVWKKHPGGRWLWRGGVVWCMLKKRWSSIADCSESEVSENPLGVETKVTKDAEQISKLHACG